ncbi:MAG: hypothetical protein RIB03_03375 [Henriciella sp.]|uniref:hypothetical protein n=1 Tax=Henriciella sp. TaxID=1968823 RepID=UPI0032F08FB7
MSFRIQSTYVSHAGMPGGLVSHADGDNYLFDLNRELFAVVQAWLEYSLTDPIKPADEAEMTRAVGCLDGLKGDARQFLHSLGPRHGDGGAT